MSMRVRTFLIFIFLFFSTIYLLPSFTSLPEGWWFHKKPLNYGLDIQGGAHLVYGVDVKGVLAERVERTSRGIAQDLEEEKIPFESVKPNDNKDTIVIRLKSASDNERLMSLLKKNYETSLQTVSNTRSEVQVRFFESVMETYREQIVNQAIEVIRNRVDEFGVAEPIIAAQGKDRILVQLPGISDPARAKELINKTARLEFRLVDNGMPPEKVNELVAEAEKSGNFALGKDGLSYAEYVRKVNAAVKSKLPANTMISFEKGPNARSMEAGKIAYLVRTDTDISGDMLDDAHVRPDEYGKPSVSFKFGSEGRRRFGALTGANIGRQLAIVLDEVVYSAPNIRSRIDGVGQITLGQSSFEEAQREGNLIATALRAGALPASLQQMEERSVGPSLGADSVEKGKKAGVIGLVILTIFSVFYYKWFGLVASVSLGLNVVGLLAVLSALGATLTLPGIAGITLTVGMAIDANIIIFERIKEELARGATMKGAIQDGFNNAWSAILDSNLTSAIAAGTLIYFGSGPVRGFGVTLIAGIATTMITAVFVSHWMLDVMVNMSKNKKIAI